MNHHQRRRAFSALMNGVVEQASLKQEASKETIKGT
jgi:hypothetical protein